MENVLQVAASIAKQNTHMRSSISSKLRLAITLRYLASGNSYKSLEFLSRVSRITIGHFVPEVCNAIIASLKDHLKVSNHFQNLFTAYYINKNIINNK